MKQKISNVTMLSVNQCHICKTLINKTSSAHFWNCDFIQKYYWFIIFRLKEMETGFWQMIHCETFCFRNEVLTFCEQKWMNNIFMNSKIMRLFIVDCYDFHVMNLIHKSLYKFPVNNQWGAPKTLIKLVHVSGEDNFFPLGIEKIKKKTQSSSCDNLHSYLNRHIVLKNPTIIIITHELRQLQLLLR